MGLAIGYYVLAFACLIGASGVLRALTGSKLTDLLQDGLATAFLGHAALLLALGVAPAAVLILLTRGSFPQSGWALRAWLRRLGLGALLGAGAMALLAAVLAATGALRVEIAAPSISDTLLLLAPWALLWLVQAMQEEAFARGYGFVQLSRALGFWPAALLSSAAFAAGHLGNAGETPLGLANAALLGLGFAYSLRLTGSLWLALGFHAAWNFMQSTVFGFANSGEAAPDSLAHAALAGPQLLTGGGAGPEGGVLTTAAALLFIVLLRLTHATTAADGDAGHAV